MFQTCAFFCPAPCSALFAYSSSFLLLSFAFALPFMFFRLCLLSACLLLVLCIHLCHLFSTLLVLLKASKTRHKLLFRARPAQLFLFSEPALDSDEDDDTCCLDDAPPFAKAQRCLCSLASKGASKSESESCSDDCDALVLMRYLLAARLRFLDTRSLRGRGMFELYNTSTQIFLLFIAIIPK